MESLAELTGFFAAHGIWCVSDSGPLIPMLGYRIADGSRGMDRLAAAQLEQGVAQGEEWLRDNPHRATHAVLVYDGFVTLDSGKTDALMLRARKYGPSPGALDMLVPYRNPESGFTVYRPKFVEVAPDTSDYSVLSEAFFRGVDSHEKGAEVWNAHLDQSR
ncbi:MAG: hypothetical protein JXR96_12645 [Deltaproteobacteria bacterium]|nr:hypothetical protein [Deltaproteobacteria bacterium]